MLIFSASSSQEKQRVTNSWCIKIFMLYMLPWTFHLLHCWPFEGLCDFLSFLGSFLVKYFNLPGWLIRFINSDESIGGRNILRSAVKDSNGSALIKSLTPFCQIYSTLVATFSHPILNLTYIVSSFDIRSVLDRVYPLLARALSPPLWKLSLWRDVRLFSLFFGPALFNSPPVDAVGLSEVHESYSRYIYIHHNSPLSLF